MADNPLTTDRPRKRPWLRRVGLVGGCLLAGAIINVLVAWALLEKHFRSTVQTSFEWEIDQFADRERDWLSKSGEYTLVDGVRLMSTTGVEGRFFPLFDSEIDTGLDDVLRPWDYHYPSYERVTVGLPFRAFAGAAWFRSANWLSANDSSDAQLLEDLLIVVRDGPDHPVHQLIPYGVDPAGMIANSVIYGTIMWVMILAPLAWLRHQRAKCNLCPDCGYDLRGADHGKCPECGEALKAV